MPTFRTRSSEGTGASEAANPGGIKRTRVDVEAEVKRIRDEAKKLTEESFAVPASDNQGRASSVSCNVQPFIFREMEELLYSHRFPFRTRGDLVRWCVFWGMRRLEEYTPGKGIGLLKFAEMEVNKYRDETYINQFMAAGGMLDGIVELYLKEGTDAGKAKAYITVKDAYDRSMEIRQPYWRKKKREEIRKKYGHILQNPPKITRVSLDPEQWENEEEEEEG